MTEVFETLEFRTNGSLTITDVIKRKDDEDRGLAIGGTYAMMGTNCMQMKLEPDMKLITSSFVIHDDQLEMVAMTPGVDSAVKKYHRVKP